MSFFDKTGLLNNQRTLLYFIGPQKKAGIERGVFDRLPLMPQNPRRNDCRVCSTWSRSGKIRAGAPSRGRRSFVPLQGLPTGPCLFQRVVLWLQVQW